MKKFQIHRLTTVNKLCWLTLILSIGFTSCQKEPLATNSEDELATAGKTAALLKAPNVVVHNGSSIQAAINAAVAGTIISIEPGTYAEAIVVNKPGIQLIGLKKSNNKAIIIENPGDEEDGITVTDAGDGFVLENVTVQNFEENGVLLTRVDNFVLDHVKAINNGEYGLFPVLSSHGVIKFCSATGSSDTGIYVGQSSDITVQFNEAYENVSGFEIENCTNVDASWNESYNNSAGLLVFLLPGLQVKSSSNITVSHNKIHDNNHINFAPPGGGFEVYVPQGSGILLLGADNTTIEHNSIGHNNFVGIATVSTLVLGALAGIPPEAFADIEPNPDGAKIVHNLLDQNGLAGPPGLPLPAVDLLWDGSGTNNCWKFNLYTSSFPASLPECN